MPPVRTISTFKPVKTERTHEENQERAYIAASRRSDRSLEARVESARRASEIHKKRTGRSLRVREEDVMNEEMYEEEDDDLPMQYRRINALNPHLSYAFAERLNNYINGQIGVRTALQQAIQQSNQYTQSQQMLNSPLSANPSYNPASPLPMQSVPQSPWPVNTNGMPQHMRLNSHQRSMSLATPQEMAQYQANTPTTPQEGAIATGMSMHDRRMSQSAHSTSGVPTFTNSPHSMSPQAQKKGQSPTDTTSTMGAPLPPNYHPSRAQSLDSQIAPLTIKLPNETLQMLNGMPTFDPAFFPAQVSPGQTTPNLGKYSYNPNGKMKQASNNGYFNYEKPLKQFNLNQTLTQMTMDPNQANFFPPTSDAPSAFQPQYDPSSFDHFAGLGEHSDLSMPMGFEEPLGNSGLITPGDAAAEATFGEFFDFQATPE